MNGIEGLRAEAKLGRVGLADEDRTGGAHASDLDRVRRRDLVGEDARALCPGQPGHGFEILHGDGEAVHPAGIAAGRKIAILAGSLDDEIVARPQGHNCIHVRIEPLDPIEGRLHDLDAGDRAGMDGIRKRDGGHRHDVGVGHLRSEGWAGPAA